MYTNRNEDLSFLRELQCPRDQRDAKSTSPRPTSAGASIGDPPNKPCPNNNNNNNSGAPSVASATAAVSSSSSSSVVVGGAGEAAATASAAPFLGVVGVRQNSLPASHSLDDSQLKVGYNSGGGAAAVVAASTATSATLPKRPLPKRKTSANIPYVLSESDLERSLFKSLPSNKPNQKAEEASVGVAAAASSASVHQRTASSPCQLMFTAGGGGEAGGFTSEDEPEMLELRSLRSLSRSTAKLLQAETDAAAGVQGTRAAVARVGSVKRHRVSPVLLGIL